MKKKIKLVCSLSMLILNMESYGQSFNADASISIGRNPTGQRVMLHISPGVGYSFNNKSYLYGGIDISLFSLDEETTSNELTTTNEILSIATYGGYRYSWPLGIAKKGTNKKQEVGAFLDSRVYFTPILPRKIRYEEISDDLEVFQRTSKGEIKSQLAFGLAAGLYFKPIEKDSYWALRVEYNNLDPFEVVRKLEFPSVDELPGNTRISIGISLFF